MFFTVYDSLIQKKYRVNFTICTFTWLSITGEDSYPAGSLDVMQIAASRRGGAAHQSMTSALCAHKKSKHAMSSAITAFAAE